VRVLRQGADLRPGVGGARVSAGNDRAAGAGRAARLTVVGASAGSGKTYRLTQEVLHALTHDGVPLEGLVAVTYTKRAQVELASRIRQVLLASATPERAALLPLANVGTVH